MLLTALAGLFMMHGLADHGVAHEGMTMSAADSTGQTVADVTHHVGVTSMTTSDLAVAVVIAGHEQPSNDSSMSMVGLCLAILVAMAGLAVALVLLSRHLSTLWRPLVLSIEGLLTRARDPVPPDLVRLSIMRC